MLLDRYPNNPQEGRHSWQSLGTLGMARSVIECSLRPAAPVVLTMHTGNRQGSKPTRRTYTGRSEVQLEKWGVWCPHDIEYASCTLGCTMTSPHTLQPLRCMAITIIIFCINMCSLFSITCERVEARLWCMGRPADLCAVPGSTCMTRA